MPGRDPVKSAARQRRYRERQKVKKYGPAAVGVDMRGRHGNHARGERHGRYNTAERRLTSQGYVAVRVAADHPHAWGPPKMRSHRYAYEHVLVVTERIGRALRPDEAVHHLNGIKTDNRSENLELVTVSEHARVHDKERGRDSLGRFPPKDRKGGDLDELRAHAPSVCVREWPAVTR